MELRALQVQVLRIKANDHAPSLFIWSAFFLAFEAAGGVGWGGGADVLFVRALVSVTCGTTSAMMVT
jgi:hypothetical protein